MTVGAQNCPIEFVMCARGKLHDVQLYLASQLGHGLASSLTALDLSTVVY